MGNNGVAQQMPATLLFDDHTRLPYDVMGSSTLNSNPNSCPSPAPCSVPCALSNTHPCPMSQVAE